MIRKSCLSCLLMALTAPVFAADCGSIKTSLDESAFFLDSAVKEGNFVTAREYVGEAIAPLKDAVYAAKDCRCDYASAAFRMALNEANAASKSADSESFRYRLDRSVQAYNAAFSVLKGCFSLR